MGIAEDELTRRALLVRAGGVSLAALIAAAVPAAALAQAEPGPPPGLADATLQAFADTIIPGRKALVTDLGHAVHPLAIAGVDADPGAVEADVLVLYHHAKTGFDSIAPAFLVELERRSLVHGGHFLALGWDERVETCKAGLDFGNPLRVLWEAAAAVPFTAFCAAAVAPEQSAARASGLRVMGHPGVAPAGYRDFSYRRVLARERTRKGWLA